VLDLLKLAGILALIVGLIRLKWNLGVVLLLAAVGTDLLFIPISAQSLTVALDGLSAAVEPLTLKLAAIVLLISFLGEILHSTLQMEGMMKSLSSLFTDRRWLLALMPMFIGLLPMIGGAMFSAPMVQEASQGLDVSRERRWFVNYWFRHSLEAVFPIYPSFVVAAGLMGISPQALSATQWPLLVAALAGGILFGLVGIRPAQRSSEARLPRKDNLLLLLKSIWPIALVLLLALALHLDLVLALLVTIVLLLLVYRLGPRKLWEFARATPISAVFIIAGTMVFRRVLEASGAVEAVSSALTTAGIPLPLIVFAVPLIPGLLTGVTVAAFAIGFPIVFPLCPPDLIGSGYGPLAFAGGYVGILLSPVHLCLSLTRVYYQAEWGEGYRRFLPAGLLVTLVAVAMVLLR